MTGSIYPINLDYAICLKKQPGFGCLSLSTLTAGDGKNITFLLLKDLTNKVMMYLFELHQWQIRIHIAICRQSFLLFFSWNRIKNEHQLRLGIRRLWTILLSLLVGSNGHGLAHQQRLHRHHQRHHDQWNCQSDDVTHLRNIRSPRRKFSWRY